MNNTSEVLYFSLTMAYRFDAIYWRRGQAVSALEFSQALSSHSALQIISRIPFIAYIVYESYVQRMWSESTAEALRPLWSYVLTRQTDRVDWLSAFMKKDVFRTKLLELATALEWTSSPL
jgi:hypothetical protein